MRVILSGLLVCLVVTGTYADTVYMSDGQHVTGKILRKNEEAIIIQTITGREEIARKYVQRVVIDTPSQPTKPAVSGANEDDEWDEPVRPSRAVGTVMGKSAEGIIKMGLDVAGNHTASLGRNSSTESVVTGVSFVMEGVHYINRSNSVGVGAGIAYQLPRRMSEYTGNFNFLPVYGMLKVRSQPVAGQNYYYAVGQLGYNQFFGDSAYLGSGKLEGGLYYGLGGGMGLGRAVLEILYTVNRGRYSYSDYYYGYSYNLDVTYTKLSVSAGYMF